MASEDLAQRVADLLGKQRYLAVALGRIVEAATGLTPVQAGTLLAIADGAQRTSEIAEQTHQHPSGVSRTIESLVQAGLVERRPDPEDRRAITVSITPAGKELEAQVLAVYRGTLADALDRMPAQEAQRYVDGAETFVEAAIAVVNESER